MTLRERYDQTDRTHMRVLRAIISALLVGSGAMLVTGPAYADVQEAIGGDSSEPALTSISRTFSDVPTDHVFYEAITWLGSSGISGGWDEGNGTYTYRPGNPISREAMAAFLFRYAGSPEYTAPTKSRFSDVGLSDEFYTEIHWLASKKITTGYDDGTFKPRRSITREAMAAFMYRYEDGASSTTKQLFSDVKPGHAFFKEANWMATRGISTGYKLNNSCPDYRPSGQVTREAMAAFIFRLDSGGSSTADLNCVPAKPPVKPTPPPVKPTPPPVKPTPPPATKPGNPGDTKNCSDFATYKDAYAWYTKYYNDYGDVAKLDRDKDGIPCESLPGAPKK